MIDPAREPPILVVEDDESTAELARRTLMRSRRVVRAVRRVDEALRLISLERFTLAILDYRLEDGDAWPVLDAAREKNPPLPVILVTGLGDERVAAEAIHRGAADYVIKSGDFWNRLPGLVDRVARAAQADNDNALLASVVQFSDEAIISESLSGEVMSWNPAAERIFGYSAAEIVGSSARVLLPPDRAQEAVEIAATLKAGGHVTGRETVRRRKNGTLVDVLESVSPIRNGSGAVVGTAIVARDVTEHRNLEAQFRHAQKMEAVGRLAGGVAHDFNNILTVITGYSDLMLEKVSEDDPLRSDIGEVKRAGERAEKLTRQLLAFSRKQAYEPVVVDVDGVIAEMETLLRRLIGEDVELLVSLGAGRCMIRVDPGHVEQIVVNLAVNARDAMPEGGTLSISTRIVELDDAYARLHADVRPGVHLSIYVADTGVGMGAETRARLFEPFFTTKAPGKGTGLGLSTVHGIVKQSGGHVGVYSEPGLGTTFKVYFPRVEGEDHPARPAPSAVASRGGAETVLVAEDDTAIRKFVGDVLRAHGYTVIDAQDGRDALVACDGHKGSIDLVITDVVMQGVGGRDLARDVLARRPGTKVLYMSGYSDARQTRIVAGAPFLDKPFTRDMLLAKVREVLDARES